MSLFGPGVFDVTSVLPLGAWTPGVQVGLSTFSEWHTGMWYVHGWVKVTNFDQGPISKSKNGLRDAKGNHFSMLPKTTQSKDNIEMGL